MWRMESETEMRDRFLGALLTTAVDKATKELKASNPTAERRNQISRAAQIFVESVSADHDLIKEIGTLDSKAKNFVYVLCVKNYGNEHFAAELAAVIGYKAEALTIARKK